MVKTEETIQLLKVISQVKQSSTNNISICNLQQQQQHLQHLHKQQKLDELLFVKKKKRSSQCGQLITKKAKVMLQILNSNNNNNCCCNYTINNNDLKSEQQHNPNCIQTNISSSSNNTNATISNSTNGNNNSNNLNHKSIIKPCNVVSNSINCNNLKTLYRHPNTSTNNMMFNRKTGLPLSSSPIPQRKATGFSFERLIKSTNAIKRAVLNKEPETDENFNLVVHKTANISPITNSLLGTFEESILNGRLEPVNTIFHGFRAEIGTSGSIYGNFFCPDHLKMPVIVYFYNIHELGNVYASPYLAKVNLGKKGYLVPRKGNVQVTLFNPEDNIVKMFVVHYDLSEMPANSQSFVRQKTFYMPKQWDNNAAGSKTSNNTITLITNNINTSQTQSSNSSDIDTVSNNDYNISLDNNSNISSNDNNSNNIVNSDNNNLISLTTDKISNQIVISQKEDLSTSNSTSKLKPKPSWLRYLIHLRFLSSKSGKIYLHRDIRMLIFRKNEFDPGNLTGQTPTFQWKIFTEQPNNPRFSPR